MRPSHSLTSLPTPLVCKAALFRLLNAYLHQNQHPLFPVFYLSEGDEFSDLMAQVISEKWSDIVGGETLTVEEKTRVAAPVIRFGKYDGKSKTFCIAI